MDKYYDILELKPGASAHEVKKAYFRLIRKYTPESDPEKFQEIRNAYEKIKDFDDMPLGPQFSVPSEPWAQKMLNQIEIYRTKGYSEKYRDACQEAWDYFPEEIQFLYMLIIAQRECGNTGKAVKNAELLVKKEPQNKWFQRELAISYAARGFAKKACVACKDAYELGCRDNDFLLTYSEQCFAAGEDNVTRQILWEIINREKKWTKEDIGDLVAAYMGLFAAAKTGDNTDFIRIVDSLCNSLEQYRIYMENYIAELSIMISMMSYLCADMEQMRKVKGAFNILMKACHDQSELDIVKEAIAKFDYVCIMEDSRICSSLKEGYEAYYNDDPDVVKFAMLDAHLCMIEEREEILREAEILKKDYPDYYDRLKDFLGKLQSESNIIHIKDSLLRAYNRIYPDYSGGVYFERYPEEKRKVQGTVITNGSFDAPYVRSSQKIGRNDLCPCGSGKKYKHCCMKNQR